MKTENPIQYILKETTVEIIEKLYCSGKYATYKAAAEEFFTRAKASGQGTGFKMNDFDKFYQNYRKYKSKQNSLK